MDRRQAVALVTEHLVDSIERAHASDVPFYHLRFERVFPDDIYAAMLPTLVYQPGVHVNYQETVLHIHDGVPKMKDMPAEMGGSGITLSD